MTACGICQSELPKLRRDTSNIVQLPCGHEFHASCTLRWLIESNTCPLCRFPVIPIAPPQKEIQLVHIQVPTPAKTPYTEHLAKYFWISALYFSFFLFVVSSLIAVYFLYYELCEKGLIFFAKITISIFVIFMMTIFIMSNTCCIVNDLETDLNN